MTVEKPKQHTRTYLDYTECAKYISEKYAVNLRDITGYWRHDYKSERQGDQRYLLDFDEYVYPSESNCSTFTNLWDGKPNADYDEDECGWFSDIDTLPEHLKGWQQKYIDIFFEEFGEYRDEDGYIEFWVEERG